MAKAAKKLTKTVAKAAPQKTAPKVHKQKLSRPAANEESDMEPQGEAEQNEDEEEEEEEASSEEGGEPASKATASRLPRSWPTSKKSWPSKRPKRKRRRSAIFPRPAPKTCCPVTWSSCRTFR